MSRDTLPGKAAHHHLIVGVDSMVLLPGFFGQVIEEDEEGEEKDDAPLVWIGGSVAPVRDLGQMVEALKPSGEIPLALQLQLVEELDRLSPFPLSVLGQQLAAVCRQAPESLVTATAGPQERVLLMLGERGWPWTPWPLGEVSPTAVVPGLLFPNQLVRLEYLGGYSSDGMSLDLPVCTVSAHGAALCGPVALLNEGRDCGLSAKQVQVVQQELFCYVDTFNLVFFLLPFFPTSQSCGRCVARPGHGAVVSRVGPLPVVAGRKDGTWDKNPLCSRLTICWMDAPRCVGT